MNYIRFNDFKIIDGFCESCNVFVVKMFVFLIVSNISTIASWFLLILHSFANACTILYVVSMIPNSKELQEWSTIYMVPNAYILLIYCIFRTLHMLQMNSSGSIFTLNACMLCSNVSTLILCSC